LIVIGLTVILVSVSLKNVDHVDGAYHQNDPQIFVYNASPRHHSLERGQLISLPATMSPRLPPRDRKRAHRAPLDWIKGGTTQKENYKRYIN